jgi:murein DD-endopeptidase MepM/ murein hydrolase activator NlpD
MSSSYTFQKLISVSTLSVPAILQPDGKWLPKNSIDNKKVKSKKSSTSSVSSASYFQEKNKLVSKSNDKYFYLAGIGIIVASALSLGFSDVRQNINEVITDSKKVFSTKESSLVIREKIFFPTTLVAPIFPNLPQPMSLSDSLPVTTSQYIVKPGDTFTRVLRNTGVNFDRIDVIGQEIIRRSKNMPFKSSMLIAGETLLIDYNISKKEYSLLRDLSDEGKIRYTINNIGDIKVTHIPTEVRERMRVVGGVVQTSLSRAAHESNLPLEVVDQIVDLFGEKVDFRKDLRSGDTFAIKYVERVADSGSQLSSGTIEAASIRVGTKVYAAIRHELPDGKVVYFDEMGSPLGNYFLRYPLRYTRISSVFSDARLHPVLKYRRPHFGVDFAAPVGTPVRTVGEGIVVTASYNGGAGKMVKIRHNSTYSTAYLHLSAIDKNIKVGSKVERGQVIGAVGQTGLASGPHLHFSLYKNGSYIDPLKANLQTISMSPEDAPKAMIQEVLGELKRYHKGFSLASNVAEQPRV